MTYFIAHNGKLLMEQFDNVEDTYDFIKSIPKRNISLNYDVYQVLRRSETIFTGMIKQDDYDFITHLLPTYELIRTLKVHHKEYTEIEYLP